MRFIAALALMTGPALGEDSLLGALVGKGPNVAVQGAAEAAAGDRCAGPGRAYLAFTFADPQGIEYAAVKVEALGARPVVSDFMETVLWLPDYARPARQYRWRYEDDTARLAQHTIPVHLDVLPGAGPLQVYLLAKDGRENLSSYELELLPTVCR